MNPTEPPIDCTELERRVQSFSEEQASAESAAAILVRMEECLDGLDRLGWSLQAAHQSQAVESVRDMVASTRLRMNSLRRSPHGA